MRERYIRSYPIWPDEKRYSGVTYDRETSVVYPQSPCEPRAEMPDAEVLARYVPPFSLRLDDGTTRDMNNLEMSRLLAEKRRLAYERRDAEGCCGDEGHDGRCYGCGGWCLRVTEAATAELFCTNLLQWLEPKDTDYVDDDRDEATSGGRTARARGQSQTNYDPADDVR